MKKLTGLIFLAVLPTSAVHPASIEHLSFDREANQPLVSDTSGSAATSVTAVELDMIAAMAGVISPPQIPSEVANQPTWSLKSRSAIYAIAPAWLKGGVGEGAPARIALTVPAPFERQNCNLSYSPSGIMSAAGENRRYRYFSAMVAAACEAGVPARLYDALLIQESGYNPYALSPAGARGIAQLMPGTAQGLGVLNAFDPLQALSGGARYLAQQLRDFGDPISALAAYNAGPARVRQYGGLPPFNVTRAYVRRISANYSVLLANEGRFPSSRIMSIGQGSKVPQQLAASLSFRPRIFSMSFGE